MKRLTLLLFLLATVSYGQGAKFGVRIGFTVADLYIDGRGFDTANVLNSDRRMEYVTDLIYTGHVGGFVEIKLPKKFYIEPGVNLTILGAEYENVKVFKGRDDDYESDNYYRRDKVYITQLNLPIWIKYRAVAGLHPKIGAYVGNLFIYRGFGIATFIPLALLALTALKLILDTKTKLLNKWFWGILWMLFLSVSFGFFSSDATILSGIGGYELNSFLSDYIGHLGTALVLLAILCVYLVGRLHITPDKIKNSIDTGNNWIKNHKKPSFSTKGRIVPLTPTDTPPAGEESFVPDPTGFESESGEAADKKIDVYTHRDDIPLLHPEEERQPTGKPSTLEGEEDSDFKVEIKQEATVDPADVARRLVEDFGEFDPTLELKSYQFPPIDLLQEYKMQEWYATMRNWRKTRTPLSRLYVTLK